MFNHRSILNNAKSPAGNALDAANAYNHISEFIAAALEAADAAVEAAEAAHSVSEGIKDKSDASKAKTQELYDKAVQGKEVVDRNCSRPSTSESRRSPSWRPRTKLPSSKSRLSSKRRGRGHNFTILDFAKLLIEKSAVN